MCYAWSMRVSWKTASVVAVLVAAVLAVALYARHSARGEAASGNAVLSAASGANGDAPPSATHDAGAHAGNGPMPLPPAVDLAALRAKLPDNLYWKLGVPVSDAEEAAQRAAAERANNALFGKVQSNTASPEEIKQYFDFKRQLATDYATFARTVIADYGPKLTADERNLYDLSIRMNDQRLKQLTKEETLAIGRRRAYEAHKAGSP